MEKKKKITIIGGGTGTHTVLKGLKKYPVDLSAVVTVADSGGSTGRLRDEFGYLPVGDVRMALAALAHTNGDSNILRQLFMYRFDKGEKGLRGHNFGNLFLVAMTDILGSEEKAIEFASKVLRVGGRVVPVTQSDVTLVAHYEDGSIIKSETHIDEPPESHDGAQRIRKLSVSPKAKILPRAKREIEEADLIVMGPGDMYTSILANIVVDGVAEAVKNASAPLVYVVNLMTKYGQTHNMTAREHVDEVVRHIGRKPDYVFINKTNLPKDILERYKEEFDSPVEDDLHKHTGSKVLRTDLLATEEVVKSTGDTLKRSLIRHDSQKLADAIMGIL